MVRSFHNALILMEKSLLLAFVAAMPLSAQQAVATWTWT